MRTRSSSRSTYELSASTQQLGPQRIEIGLGRRDDVGRGGRIGHACRGSHSECDCGFPDVGADLRRHLGDHHRVGFQRGDRGRLRLDGRRQLCRQLVNLDHRHLSGRECRDRRRHGHRQRWDELDLGGRPVRLFEPQLVPAFSVVLSLGTPFLTRWPTTRPLTSSLPSVVTPPVSWATPGPGTAPPGPSRYHRAYRPGLLGDGLRPGTGQLILYGGYDGSTI